MRTRLLCFMFPVDARSINLSRNLHIARTHTHTNMQVDLVTEVDLQAEEIIIPSIRKAVSGHVR